MCRTVTFDTSFKNYLYRARGNHEPVKKIDQLCTTLKINMFHTDIFVYFVSSLLFIKWYGGGNSTSAEEVSRFQRLFPNPSWLVWGRASRYQKLAPTFPGIDSCLMVTKRDFLEMEASLWLNGKSQNVAKGVIVYLMLLGSSRPYPWFILEENGRWTDDDDDDDDDDEILKWMHLFMWVFIMLVISVNPLIRAQREEVFSSFLGDAKLAPIFSNWLTILQCPPFTA